MPVSASLVEPDPSVEPSKPEVLPLTSVVPVGVVVPDEEPASPDDPLPSPPDEATEGPHPNPTEQIAQSQYCAISKHCA